MAVDPSIRERGRLGNSAQPQFLIILFYTNYGLQSTICTINLYFSKINWFYIFPGKKNHNSDYFCSL